MASSDYNTKRALELRDGDWFSTDGGAKWHRAAVVGHGTVSAYVNGLQGPAGGEDALTYRVVVDGLALVDVPTIIDHTDPATFAIAWLAEAEHMSIGGPYVTPAIEDTDPVAFTVRHMTHTLRIPGARMLGWDLRAWLKHNPRPVPAYLAQTRRFKDAG